MLMQVVSPPIDYGGELTQTPLMTDEVIETELAMSSSYLDRIAHRRDLTEIDTTTDVVFGLPAQNILATAESGQVDLIVICSHGRTGFKRWVLGSVAQKIARHSPVPVLVLRENNLLGAETSIEAASPLFALIPLDGSPLAETVLVPAANLVAALAAPAEGALHLLQVVKQISTTADEGFVTELNEETVERAKSYLLSVKERLQVELKVHKLSISWSVALDSDVADAIVGTAEQNEQREGTEGIDFHDLSRSNLDLIAMSTHGRGGLGRWVLGSVTERVLGASRLPMLIVRP